MKYLFVLILITFISCDKYSKDMKKETSSISSDNEDVRAAIMYNYNYFHKNDLSDSLTFDHFKTLYSDSFVLGPSEGKPLSNKETILEDWRELFRVNKGKFKLTINRVEVSGNLAYALYHYDEKLTNIKSGEIYFEVTQSAIAILRRDHSGKWKFEALRWN